MRIGATRVTLETVIHAFQRGETPEQIVYSFDVLKLADVYAVVAYYLQNQDDVNAYLRRAEAETVQARREAEIRYPDLVGLRERLLARLAESKTR
jgi:hypothetical protein